MRDLLQLFKKSDVQASQQYEVQKYNLAELKSHEMKVFVFCSVLIIAENLSLQGRSENSSMTESTSDPFLITGRSFQGTLEEGH